MTSHNYIPGSFQSAAKLAVFFALIGFCANGKAQQTPTTTSVPAARGSEIILSPQDVLSLLPETLDTRPGGSWNGAAVTQADAVLHKVVRGQQATFTFPVHTIIANRDGIFIVESNLVSLPEPYPYNVAYYAHFSANKGSQLAKIAAGSLVSVSGTMDYASLNRDPRQVLLTIEIKNAEIVDLGPAPATAAITGKNANTTPTARGTASSSTSHLVLAQGWDTEMQGGSATMEDLGRIFGEYGKPRVNLAGDNSIIVYPGIPYLTPVRQALETLKPGTRLPSKALVSCPGFPRDSFYYYAIDGLFEGHFNRAYVVTDRADQVVSVQFVDEHPINEASISGRQPDWHTYNFVNNRTKSMSTLKIEHAPELFTNSAWHQTGFNDDAMHRAATTYSSWSVLRLRSVLKGPVRNSRNISLKVMEEVMWYVPRPVVELILTCVEKSIK